MIKIIAKKAKKLLASADDGSKECKIYNDGFLDGVEWGYKEAMRWRNPKEESPPVGAYVQLKTFHPFHNKQMCTHDEYIGNNKWKFWKSEYLEIIGWRPIE